MIPFRQIPYELKLNVLRASIYVYSINYIYVIHLGAAYSKQNTWLGRVVFEVFIIYETKWLSAKRICTWLMVYVYTYICIIYKPEKRWKSFTIYMYIYTYCVCAVHTWRRNAARGIHNCVCIVYVRVLKWKFLIHR